MASHDTPADHPDDAAALPPIASACISVGAISSRTAGSRDTLLRDGAVFLLLYLPATVLPFVGASLEPRSLSVLLGAVRSAAFPLFIIALKSGVIGNFDTLYLIGFVIVGGVIVATSVVNAR